MSGKKKGRVSKGRRGWLRWTSGALGAFAVLGLGVVIGMQLRPAPAPKPAVAVAVAPAPKPTPPRRYPPAEGAEPEVAALPAPAVPAPEVIAPPLVTEPAALSLPPPAGWRRHAVAPPEIGGRPMIAIVIDDLGVDRKRSDKIVKLPGPLTAAFMSYAEDVARQARAARSRGHELLLHMPMEPQGENYDPGPDVLEVGLPAEEVRRRVVQGLNRFEGMIGLNNHMGSRFTADAAGMEVVMDELSRRGLVFLDSLTTGRSVGVSMARRQGVPAVARDIFLDNDPRADAVRLQLAKTEQVARRHGHAIAIGHPYDGTIQALAEWVPTLPEKGLVLVPLSAIVKRQFPSG